MSNPFYVNKELLGAARAVSDEAVTYRMVLYPDGRKTLQGGHLYFEGMDSGIEWRDMPLVPVDEKGQEIGMQVTQ